MLRTGVWKYASHPRVAARAGAGFLLVLLSVAAYTQTRTGPPKLTVHKIKGDLYEVEGAGGNVAVYVTSEGVILVDDKNFGGTITDSLLAQVKMLSDKPIKYVFNTHYHGDHTGGNAALLPTAEIISTDKARASTLGHGWEISYAYRGITGTPARMVFTREASVFLGGKEVRARYFGRGHTDGDAVIYFPAERTIHTGDLMTEISGPLIDYEGGGSLVEEPKTLDKVLSELDFDVVIPGHGPVSDKAGLIAYRDSIVKLRDRVTGLIHEGKSRDDIARVMTAEYGWGPGSRNMTEWTFPGMMRELK